jgi:hypothetical protein
LAGLTGWIGFEAVFLVDDREPKWKRAMDSRKAPG